MLPSESENKNMCTTSKSRRRTLLATETSIDFSSDSDSRSSDPAVVKKDEAQSEPDEKTKREIQHNYHDHADNDGAIYREAPVISKGGVTVPFPTKLHNMLEYIALHETELNVIVSWQPHGRCFLVRNTKAFGERVLPRFFQQKKYASFQRQLNLYGFNRLTKGPDRGSYYHELFLRSKQILCRGIHRMKVKGTGSRMASNPEQEPNFYHMTSMPPSVMPIDKDSSSVSKSKSAQPLTAVSSAVNYEPDLPKTKCRLSSITANTRIDCQGINTGNAVNSMEDLNFVFDNMPFHELAEGKSRRHSLMDASRRQSMKLGGHRNSIIINDEEFDRDMEKISQLGKGDLSDFEMGSILDKIIDHRII
jgi:hypothetical protein